MNTEALERLSHALAACETVANFCAGKTREDYLADVLLRSAVERQFEIIGEALDHAAQLDGTVESRVPELRRSPVAADQLGRAARVRLTASAADTARARRRRLQI